MENDTVTTLAKPVPEICGQPLRSLLFCPGTEERRMTKALAAGADAVIFDLEDSVAPAAKPAARDLVAGLLTKPRPCPVVVRINAADTEWHLKDLATTAAAAADAVMLPKCAGPDDLRRLAAQLDVLEAGFGIAPGSIGILPLVTETAAAVSSMAYANVTPRLAALCFAGEDLASDLGVAARHDGVMNPLLSRARQAMAFAAASAGVSAIDTPFPDPKAPGLLETETRAAVGLGFAGKLCIHPAQIETVHTAFRPDGAQIAWGRAVIAALEDGDTVGVATIDGKMVDIAHLRLARRYLRMAKATETTE